MQGRIDIAVSFLKDGKSFKVDDLLLSLNEANGVEVTGWSQYTNIQNVSKQIALNELQEIKLLFTQMLDFSTELTNFVEGRPIIFNLCLDDYGKASLGICSEKDGVVIWGSLIS
ncbi:MAG: hypothetical protein K0Q79_1433 [Flavipsychrobacter sp.]|jgi:hypothetical protein|nr:hypothetical protein [Flavipsychrobacter sp.]